jgi:hypothetical protein
VIYIVQNFWPILAATLAGLAVGVAHHLATGRAAHAPVATRPPLLVIALVAEFWLACILAGALILAPPEAPRWVMAMATPVVIWIGFVAPALVVTHAYRRISLRLAAFDAGHWLVVMVVQAAVMTLIGLKAPVS